jgi:hypothetical protein
MIEKFLVSELGTIDALNGQFYPVAAPVGDVEGNFCIYTRVSGEIQRDLTGEPVFYQDVYRLDLYGEDTDSLFALETEMISALSKINVDFGELFIFSAEPAPGAPDGFDLTMEINQRSMAYTVMYWR